MSYDAINKMTVFDNGDGTNPKTGQYFYDGAGNRVKRVTSDSGASETVTYVYDAFGKLAAEYSSKLPTEPAGTLFRTTDHLGSTRLVTDAAGAVHTRGCRDFFPFGERIDSGVGNRSDPCYGGTPGDFVFDQRFTAKERDEESDLDYFGARYFSASLGRFTSPDWSLTPQPVPFADLNDPQTLNLYAYVRNNPLGRIDPDGHDDRPCNEGQPGCVDGVQLSTEGDPLAPTPRNRAAADRNPAILTITGSSGDRKSSATASCRITSTRTQSRATRIHSPAR